MNGFSNSKQLRRLPVEVIRSDNRVKTIEGRIVDGVIKVRIPSWMGEQQETERVSAIVNKIEKRRRAMSIDLVSRANELAQRFDLPTPDSIRWSTSQQRIWGSCSTGSRRIRISHQLADVPHWVLDQVIVHELVHLVVPDHSEEFHKLLNRYPLSERAIGYLAALSAYNARRGGFGEADELLLAHEAQLPFDY